MAGENDDLGALHLAQPVADLLDQDAVPHLERGKHRAGGDKESLDQEGLDDHCDQEGEEHQYRQLEDLGDHTPAAVSEAGRESRRDRDLAPGAARSEAVLFVIA